MQHDKQLEEYGIFATNAKLEIKDNKITIINDENTKRAEIENIDCQKLQEKGVQKIDFRGCTFIKYLSLSESELYDTNIEALTFYGCYFMESVSLQNINIWISFIHCDFDQEAIFRGSNFNNQKTITFAHITFNKKADFTGATFNQNTEFLDITFKEEANFYMTEFNCDKVTFNITCNKEANFKESFFENSAIFGNCDFKEDLNISIEEYQKINFEKNKFNTIIIQKEFFSKNVNFKECIFLEKLVLKDYDFNEITFNTCIFQDNVYFNNSIFEDYVDFHECEFEKVVCFYGVEFKKVPNFSQAKFIGNLDPVNMKMDFDINDIKQSIEKAKEILENKNNNNEKKDYKFANDFRDSFRVFKSALIKDNNLLEASRFHKYELYAKEIELDYKENKTLKDKIDHWQIVFYRKLCEHHTDLLLNLKWLVIAIGLFASLYFISRSIQDIGILEFLNTFGACFSIACAFIMLVLYWFGHIERLDFFASIGTVITLLAIYYKPQLIFGIANLFGDTKYNGLENFLITIYTIVIGLIIFSLQKTARKNSIVPN